MVSTRNLIALLVVLLMIELIATSMVPLPYKKYHNLKELDDIDDDDDYSDDNDDTVEYDIDPRRQPNYRRKPVCVREWTPCDGSVPCCGGRLCSCMWDLDRCYCTFYAADVISPRTTRPDYLNYDLKDNSIG